MYRLVAAIGIFVASAGVAMACSLTPDADRMKTIEENFSNTEYQHVFTGRVESVQEVQGAQGPQYTIAIAESYRGDVDGEVVIGSAAHSCGSFYTQGDILVWFLDKPDYVDELNPQYRFNSIEAAQARMSDLRSSEQEGSPTNTPHVAGPTSAPGVGFVGPQSPPPGQEEMQEEESESWYQRLFSWIQGLFK